MAADYGLAAAEQGAPFYLGTLAQLLQYFTTLSQTHHPPCTALLSTPPTPPTPSRRTCIIAGG